MEIIDIARVCHEANRALQMIQGDPSPSPSWENAEQWQVDAAIDEVKKAQNGATSRQLHYKWCQLKTGSGWVYGEVKDADKKTHPCLVPYEDLPEEQRIKDDLFNAIVKALS